MVDHPMAVPSGVGENGEEYAAVDHHADLRWWGWVKRGWLLRSLSHVALPRRASWSCSSAILPALWKYRVASAGLPDSRWANPRLL